MSKLFTFLLVGGLALGTLAAVNDSPKATQPPAEFLAVSVLANHQADYGVDEDALSIPSISLNIVSDKLRDEGKVPPSLPVILFTTEQEENQNNDPEPSEQQPPQDEQDPETEEVQDPGNNGNGQEKEKEKNNNGNGQGKDKEKDKEKEKNDNGDKEKDKGKIH